MKPEFVIAYSSIASVLLPLGFVFLQRRELSTELKLLSWILGIALICDMAAFFLVEFSINTHWIGNIYLVAQFSLLAAIFRKNLQGKTFLDITFLLFVVFFFINITLFQGPLLFNSVSNVIASLIIIALSLLYFHRLLNDLPIVHIQQLPMFWIAFAALTYYAGNFFLFLLKNNLAYGESGSHRVMWILHNLLNITKNILFSIGLWQSYRKARSSISSSSAH